MHNRSKHTYCASLFFLILILLFGSSCLLTGCSGGTSSKAEANAGHSGGSNTDGSGSDADRTVFFLLGEVIEDGKTEELFSMPRDKRTEDYITGRFG